MATSDPQLAGRFSERMRAALPSAMSEAFGGMTEVASVDTGDPAALVAELDGAYHLHLELEVSAGRQEAQTLVLVLSPADGERLFDLEPTEPGQLGDPSTQLKVLAEFTEAAEALSAAFAGALASAGTIVSLRVSGASLEEAVLSPAAALAPLGDADTTACSIVLNRAPGGPMQLVFAASAGLAVLLSQAGDRMDASGASAAERAANLAARVASRRAAVPETPPLPSTPVMPPPAAPAVTAHPFAFGQIDTAAGAAARSERGVDLILDVALQVRVELGSTQMTVEEVLGLSPGSVVELDRLAGEPVDIVINDRLIARGEVVVVEENFGVRVTEIVSARSRAAALG